MTIVPSHGPNSIVSAITTSGAGPKHTPRRHTTVSGAQLEWMSCSSLQRSATVELHISGQHTNLPDREPGGQVGWEGPKPLAGRRRYDGT